MEIHFVTGKGGVGKSAVSAALALHKFKQGKRVLLVELGDQSFYKDYFDLPDVNYSPTKTIFGFDVALWTGQDCLREYALFLLKVETLYKLFFENVVTRALINVAPGLPELSILGKITSGPPRNVGPKLNYDCLIIDSFASGHFMALLRAPKGMSQAISFGPMGEQSRAITAVLKNPAISKYYIVALPEELPVVEGVELAQSIEKETGIQPQIILNRIIDIPPAALTEKTESLRPFQNKLIDLNVQKEHWLKHLSHFPYAVSKLPFVFSESVPEVVRDLEKDIQFE